MGVFIEARSDVTNGVTTDRQFEDCDYNCYRDILEEVQSNAIVGL